MSEPVRCSQVIKTCAYSSNLSASGIRFCDFLCMAGERRGCDPEACTRYKPRNGEPTKHSAAHSDILDKPYRSVEMHDLGIRKREAIKVARDFNHPESVIRSIREAKSIVEVDRILRDARRAKFK